MAKQPTPPLVPVPCFIGPGGMMVCRVDAGWTLWAVDNTTGVGVKVSEGTQQLRRMISPTEREAGGPNKTFLLTPKG